MPETAFWSGGAIAGVAVAAAAFAVLAVYFWMKGRPIPGTHVFRASRFSRGNFWFPKQVSVTETSVIQYTPELFGGREQSMHLAHVASVLIDRNLFFADVILESSGGASPVRCNGHRKADALEIKRLIDEFQSRHYRGQRAPEGRPAS